MGTGEEGNRRLTSPLLLFPTLLLALLSCYPRLQHTQRLCARVEAGADAEREGGDMLAVTDRQVVDGGDAKRADEVIKDLLQAEGIAGTFGRAVGVFADDDSSALLELSGRDQLREHPVDAIGFLIDILEEANLVAQVDLPG